MCADVEQAHAQLALVDGERGLSCCDRFQNRFSPFESRTVSAGNCALQGTAGAGGNMQIHLEPRADHADWIEDARLIVKNELAGQQVENLAVRRAVDGAGAFYSIAKVFSCDRTHARAERHSVAGIE